MTTQQVAKGPRTDRPPSGSPEPMPGRCGAKIAKSDPPRYCKSYPVRGRNRCRRCGGATPRGVDHYNFKDGMYSRTPLPRDLLARYQEFRLNPALRENTEQIALLDARTFDVFQRMDESGEGRGVLLRIGEAWKDLLKVSSMASADPVKAEALRISATERMNDAVEKGLRDEDLWSELYGLFDLRRKLVEGETKRQQAAGEMMLKAQVVMLLQSVAASINRHVSSSKEKQAILHDVDIMLTGGRRRGEVNPVIEVG